MAWVTRKNDNDAKGGEEIGGTINANRLNENKNDIDESSNQIKAAQQVSESGEEHVYPKTEPSSRIAKVEPREKIDAIAIAKYGDGARSMEEILKKIKETLHREDSGGDPVCGKVDSWLGKENVAAIRFRCAVDDETCFRRDSFFEEVAFESVGVMTWIIDASSFEGRALDEKCKELSKNYGVGCKRNLQKLELTGLRKQLNLAWEELEKFKRKDNSNSDKAENDVKSKSSKMSLCFDDIIEYKLAKLLVRVYSHDITKLKCKAIVNAANKDLQQIGGVALAIKRASGDDFQRKCDEKLKRKGVLNDGQVISVRASGRLFNDNHVEYIINAVGPNYHDHCNASGPRYSYHYEDGPGYQNNYNVGGTHFNHHYNGGRSKYNDHCNAGGQRYEGRTYQDEKERCLELLSDAIYNSLDKAEELKCESIAIPALSSGIFGVPMDICTEAYIKGLVRFAERGNIKHVEEVDFVDKDKDTTRAIQKAFNSLPSRFKRVEN